jgi:L-ascorbate metabolism protein UlaG (beta-lactamase superfamily)
LALYRANAIFMIHAALGQRVNKIMAVSGEKLLQWGSTKVATNSPASLVACGLKDLVEDRKMRISVILKMFILASSALSLNHLIADTIEGEGGSIEITALIHSSVQLEHRGRVIQIDPWNRLGLPDARQADLILITDDVGHHLDTSAIEKLRKPVTPLVMPANGQDQIDDGIVISNGEAIKVAGVIVEAVAAYDIIQGAPAHPKGEANGYVVTLGGKRFYFAGVTECVDEVKALENIDVAFLPLNVPLARMTPAAAAECARIINPSIVYPYHYDQDYARRALQPDYIGPGLPDNLTVDQTLERFAQALDGSGIEVRLANFYPPLD